MRTFGLLALVALGAPSLAQTPGYYRFPTIHGDQVVFAAEGDLWSVSVEGGLATRLTRDDGLEGYAKFSPDGRWLAFSASYQGDVDAYVMPAAGGEPRRLTWHPGPDEVIAWTADSADVVFRSRRQSPNGQPRLFHVPLAGGQPALLDIGPAALASFAPDGRVAFNRFSRENRTWKRYYGGTAQDVWVGDPASGEFERVTDFEGTDRFPMWHEGRVFFLSDRTGTMNVYSLDPATKEVTQHTDHDDWDARWPDLSGGRVVYMLGGDLHVLDLASGADRPIPIELPSDRIRHRPRVADASKAVESYALSADGGRIAVSARGELWLRPVEEGRVVQLTRSPGVRERAPAIAPDGERVLCLTDQSGEQQLALLDAAGKAPATLLEQQRQGWMNAPVWSPEGTHVAWSDLTYSLFVMDVASRAVTKVDQSPVGDIAQYVFSPDGKWLAYVRGDANGMSSIHLFELQSGRSTPVTTAFTNDGSPAWDPDGRYLYFTSDRSYNPILDQLDLEYVLSETTGLYALILQEDGLSPFLPKELLAAAEEAKKEQKDDAVEEETPEGEPAAEDDEALRIDLEGIQRRVVEFPVEPGNYFGLFATKGKLYYASRPTSGLLDMALFAPDPTPRTKLHAFDLVERESEVVIPALRDFVVSADGAKIAWRVGQEILVAPTAGKPSPESAKKVDVAKLPLKVDPPAEWAQIFHEAWRLQRDFYWDEGMAGVDWDAMGAKYGALLPRISTRDELNDVIGQMIAELGTSHTYVFGGDIEAGERVGTGVLGADLERDPGSGLLRFARVLRPEVWETDAPAPLTRNDVDVREGDYLFAVDGVDLGPGENLYAALENLAGQQVLLTVGRTPDRALARDVQVATLPSDAELRYYDWCRRNREFVDEVSGGRLGYFHMPDMMGRGLVQFAKGFYPQIEKEGLVIDARYNGGGFVSQVIIERLMREPIAYGKPRRGRPGTNPARTHLGHKVVLTNQNAGSDGDIFPKTFQLRKLGPVIGMRTWGGVVGINPGRTHVDGGLTTQPTSAWWEPGSGFGLENRGVEPDIEVDVLPADWAARRDPQLERGVAELERRLREHPVERPETPAVPDKSPPAGIDG